MFENLKQYKLKKTKPVKHYTITLPFLTAKESLKPRKYGHWPQKLNVCN